MHKVGLSPAVGAGTGLPPMWVHEAILTIISPLVFSLPPSSPPLPSLFPAFLPLFFFPPPSSSPQKKLQESVKLLEQYKQGTLGPDITNKQVSKLEREAGVGLFIFSLPLA